MQKQVLIVEPNPYHSEILPGLAKYFLDLDYGVKILIRAECKSDGNAFSLFSGEDNLIVQDFVTREAMKTRLSRLKGNEFEMILISSTSMWEESFFGPYLNFLGFIPRARLGTLFIEHNLSFAKENYIDYFLPQNRYFTLTPQSYIGEKVPFINPFYFGKIEKQTKRTKTISIIGSFANNSKDLDTLCRAIRLLKPNNRAKLKIKLIGAGDIGVADDVRDVISILGRVKFEDMYENLSETDYLMPLLDEKNDAHQKYLKGTTSGAIQLSFGFRKPLIIQSLFLNPNINYGESFVDYAESTPEAIAMAIECAIEKPDDDYYQLCNQLEEVGEKLYSISLRNLKEAIKLMSSNPTQYELDQLNIELLQLRTYSDNLYLSNSKLQAENQEMVEKINSLKKENYKLYLLSENITHSRRFKLISKIANIFNASLPPDTLRRKLISFVVSFSRTIINLPKLFKKKALKRRIHKLAKRHQRLIAYITMPWNHHLKQRPHHLMGELSKKNVFSVYIDESITDPLFISDNLLILPKENWQYYLGGLTDKLNCYYMSAAHYPISLDELKLIESEGFRLIYEYIDDLDEAIFGNLDKQIEVFNKLEELDPVLIIASARRLYDQMTKIFPDGRVILNENAVNTEHFRPKKRVKSKSPKDLRELADTGRPIVGYYGAIAPWLDYELILQATEAKSEYNFVFIGPDYHGGMEKMPEKENIFTLGPKSYDELPDYSNWFDCAIIPFEEGDIAKATSPVKLFEYMSMGIPTVCTKDLNECRGYEGVIVAKSREDFITSIDKAITYHSSKSVRAKLEEYARKNTWKARAVDIVENLKKIEGKA